jgi:hypothetical protein
VVGSKNGKRTREREPKQLGLASFVCGCHPPSITLPLGPRVWGWRKCVARSSGYGVACYRKLGRDVTCTENEGLIYNVIRSAEGLEPSWCYFWTELGIYE